MKRTFAAAAIVLLIASTAFAQSQSATFAPPPPSGSTAVSARIGFDNVKYQFVEVLRTTGSGGIYGGGFIAPNGDARQSRDTYAGLGHVIPFPGVELQAVAFVSRTSGPDADPTTSIVPWLLAITNVGRVVGTANYFAYAPINTASGIVQSIEVAKAEWDFGAALAGIGYSGSKAPDADWDNRPFLTATVKSPLGNFEVWAQRLGDATGWQVRYLRIF